MSATFYLYLIKRFTAQQSYRQDKTKHTPKALTWLNDSLEWVIDTEIMVMIKTQDNGSVAENNLSLSCVLFTQD